jgi:hypothetical protein
MEKITLRVITDTKIRMGEFSEQITLQPWVYPVADTLMSGTE